MNWTKSFLTSNDESKDRCSKDTERAPFLPDAEGPSAHLASTKRSSMSFIVIASNVLLFLCSLVLLFWSFRESSTARAMENSAWSKANAYSPVIDDIPIPMHMQHMKGTLEDLDHDIFRQPPSPAVDAAWHALSDHGFAWVSEEQALAMGWDLPVTFKIPEAFGVGNDKYGGETDILHKIHCLDMIRRDVHYDYYWGDKYPDGNRPEAFTVHTSHCIYVLLQSLLCDANTDLIPSVWLDEYPLPVPDFEIQRKCGNFEGVKNWELEHRIEVNRTTLETVKQRPKGQKARPLNAEVRRILEVDTP